MRPTVLAAAPDTFAALAHAFAAQVAELREVASLRIDGTLTCTRPTLMGEECSLWHEGWILALVTGSESGQEGRLMPGYALLQMLPGTFTPRIWLHWRFAPHSQHCALAMHAFNVVAYAGSNQQPVPYLSVVRRQVTVRAVEQKLRDVRACIAREKAAIPKASRPCCYWQQHACAIAGSYTTVTVMSLCCHLYSSTILV